MALKYFGTDGVRGPALVSPLGLDDARRWGKAWGQVAHLRGIHQLVLGWDPRNSSEPLAEAFIQGLDGALELCVLGMVPTPAVAWTTLHRPDAWGLMFSASHNPPEDNGIKGFDGQGEKLVEADEEALEAAYEAAEAPRNQLPIPASEPGPMAHYLAQVEGLELPPEFKVIVDCAHGATAPWAPRLIRGQGVEWLGVPADGARINVGVGSTHMKSLQNRVKESGADVGIAFDGDGDRCLLVDPKGKIVDGDQIMWLMAQDLQQQGQAIPGVVGTLMSNGGLDEALGTLGIPFVQTQVGDKFMLRELALRGWDLAAESSGHVIQKHLGPSGDGLSTAVACLKALLHRTPQARWAWRFRPWPLKLLNLVAPERKELEDCPQLQSVLADLEQQHGHALRVVVRWSGTEPKLRLMVEAREADAIEAPLHLLESAARSDLGL